jgi:hypothetical protein
MHKGCLSSLISFHNRANRLDLLHHPRHIRVGLNVNSSYWSPEHYGICRRRYSQAGTHHQATSDMFSAPPLNVADITVLRMTASPATIFWPMFLLSFPNEGVPKQLVRVCSKAFCSYMSNFVLGYTYDYVHMIILVYSYRANQERCRPSLVVGVQRSRNNQWTETCWNMELVLRIGVYFLQKLKVTSSACIQGVIRS